MKSLGAKRVMRQQKNPVFVVFCKQCTSPRLCKNISPQNELIFTESCYFHVYGVCCDLNFCYSDDAFMWTA